MNKKAIRLIIFSIIGVVVLAILLFSIFYDKEPKTFGVNKTIGWAWDFLWIFPVIYGVIALLSLLVYVIMYAVKAKYSKKVLIINLVLLLGAFISTFVFGVQDSVLIFTPFFLLSSMMMLYTNIIIALVRAKDRK